MISLKMKHRSNWIRSAAFMVSITITIPILRMKMRSISQRRTNDSFIWKKKRSRHMSWSFGKLLISNPGLLRLQWILLVFCKQKYNSLADRWSDMMVNFNKKEPKEHETPPLLGWFSTQKVNSSTTGISWTLHLYYIMQLQHHSELPSTRQQLHHCCSHLKSWWTSSSFSTSWLHLSHHMSVLTALMKLVRIKSSKDTYRTERFIGI